MKQEVEWSTTAPRGRQNRMVADGPRISAPLVGTHHKVGENRNKEEEKKNTWVRPEETKHHMDRSVRTCQATKLSHRVAHSQTWCFTELHKSGREQQRALVDKLPNAPLRARCASLWCGNDSRRHLQGGRSETSTQCQGRGKREWLDDGIRDATTRGLQRTTSCSFTEVSAVARW